MEEVVQSSSLRVISMPYLMERDMWLLKMINLTMEMVMKMMMRILRMKMNTT